jgi:Ca-activated chloride channel family protein
MKNSSIKIKSIIVLILSLLLILLAILPILAFFALQEMTTDFVKQVGILKILTFYLFLGMLSIVIWILSHEILETKDNSEKQGYQHGFSFFAKIVSMFFTTIIVTIQVIFLAGTVIVYIGNYLFGIDFGNVRLFNEKNWLLHVLHLGFLGLIGFLIYSFKRKTKILEKFGSLELIKVLSATVSRKAQIFKAILLVIILFYLIVAWTRPQLGTKLEMVKREGIDIIIAMDVSYSMLAEDITPNRLEKAKHEVANFIDKLKGDRIGFIAFAGVPFIQCPLTLDYGAAKIFLDVMSPDIIPEPGTAIAKAIEEAIKAFEQAERKHKVLVIITDGEDHGGEPVEAAKKAETEGIVIYTVGIGSPAGVPIPVYGTGGGLQGYKKDREGNEVITKLDEVTLEKIALQTNGKYFRASTGEVELDKIYDEISQMEKKELASKKFSQYEDRFQYILIFALFLLIIEIFIPERRVRKILS